jgi:guanine deaminase
MNRTRIRNRFKMTKEELIKRAIDLASQNISIGGGPFGAIIVKNGEIVAEGVNRVTCDNDPTAHAEVQAIRAACAKLGNFELKGCEIYTSCEPCPMCFSAIYWARLDKVYFAANHLDAEEVGFDDAFIYREIKLPHKDRSIAFEEINLKDRTLPFRLWSEKDDKTVY